MKMPSAPPKTKPPTSFREWNKVLPVGREALAGSYFHWDELRHRTPPPGFTTEQWWSAIKLTRAGLYQSVPLIDLRSKHFQYFATDETLATLHDIDMRAGGTVQMPEQVTNSETKDQYYVSSLMDEAITSSQLEGAATTREIARQMLRSNRPPRDRSEQMILNNYLTMRKLADWRQQPLTSDLVFDIHRLITVDTFDDPHASGRFRTEKELICVEDVTTGEALHTPPPANELLVRMKALCDFANADEASRPFIHPVLRAILLHFWLAYDHPFKDGNGRTARALFYWFMLRRGYWMFQFISISQFLVKAPAQYGKAFLYTETDDNDLNYFIAHQIGVIRKAVDELHHYIERKTTELHSLSAALRDVGELNHRQEAILHRAARHPGTVFTVDSHRRSHDIAYGTARADLLGLEKLLLLGKRKRGKGFAFEAATDLHSRLKGFTKR